jgi:hypothetical protein
LTAKYNKEITQRPTLPEMSKLVEILSKDKQLTEDKARMQLFLALARLFDSDLKRNLNRTSFELDDAYDTHNPHAWLEFKQYSPVRKYITEYLDEEQLMQARKSITQDGISKTKDAMDLQAIVEGKQKADQNTNIIVFYMPQKDYTKV